MDPVLGLSRIELAVNAIRDGILAHELLPGQPLVEAELAAELGVSKTPVREALKILSNSGLVVLVPYKGAHVPVVDRTMVESVYGLRRVLEPEAVRRAVLLHADFREAAAILHEDAAAPTLADLGTRNQRFHAALYRGCGNPLLIEVLDNLRDRTALISTTTWSAGGRPITHRDEHNRIMSAVLAGDADGVFDWLSRHIAASHDNIVALLDL